MNVFDYVNDFYVQDEDWNNVLPRKQVENYLRSCSWQGKTDAELQKIWERITLLCIFLGNSENFLGDMNREDFIDCTGWCARNIADFTVDSENIIGFLNTLSDFYQFLGKRREVLNYRAPLEALRKMVPDGRQVMLKENGEFYPQFNKYNQYVTPDLPVKVFLNVGERMDNLLQALHDFYDQEAFNKDFDKASFLYGSMMMSANPGKQPDMEELSQCYWDFFLFDYHLLQVDKTPLEYFADEYRQGHLVPTRKVSRDMLAELLKARLVLFTIKAGPFDDAFECQDFLTGESYSLMLPLEAVPKEKILFVGHIFYNNTMMVNFMRGVHMPGTSLKRLAKALQKCKDWYVIRQGHCSWDEFVARYALLVRQAVMFSAGFSTMITFTKETQITSYEASPLLEDAVNGLIAKFMSAYAFCAHDILLTRTLWSDFQSKANKKVLLPDVWAAGVIRVFCELNAVYRYDAAKVSEMCQHVPISSINCTAKEITEVLAIEAGDPRYVSEDGMLGLLIN